MTEPDPDQRIIRYMAELGRAEQAGAEPILVAVGPFTAMLMIGALQLATRHPSMAEPHKRAITRVVDQLAPAFTGTTGEELIERGKDPEQDVVPTAVAGTITGPTFDESGNYWHDWWRIDIGQGENERLVLVRDDPGAEHLASIIAAHLRRANDES